MDRTDYGFPPRCRNACVEQAGNSMNIACIGFMHLWRLAFVAQADESVAAMASQLVQEGHKRRKLLGDRSAAW